jgi:uncharacterized protein (DUF433 family)
MGGHGTGELAEEGELKRPVAGLTNPLAVPQEMLTCSPKRGPGIIQHMATPTTTATNSVLNLEDYIVKTPGVCSGQPRIAGTRIKVKHVYTWVEQMGMAPAQVVAEYPHLTMAQIHAALAYYWSHREEIHQDIEKEDQLVAELMAKAGPSRIQERLTEQDATDDALPPG